MHHLINEEITVTIFRLHSVKSNDHFILLWSEKFLKKDPKVTKYCFFLYYILYTRDTYFYFCMNFSLEVIYSFFLQHNKLKCLPEVIATPQ
jgi:hypothetical protein